MNIPLIEWAANDPRNFSVCTFPIRVDTSGRNDPAMGGVRIGIGFCTDALE